MTTFAILALELACLYGLGRRLLAGVVGDALYAGRLRRGLTWVALGPGIALHETAHAVVALAVGAKVERFVPFRPQVGGRGSGGDVTLGYVVHRGAKGGPVGRAAIGLAPLWVVPLLAYVVGCALVPGVAVGDDPARLPAALWAALPDPGTVVYLLLVLSASVGLLPSPTDHRDLPAALAVLVVVAGAWLLIAGVPGAQDAGGLLGTAGGAASFAAQLLAVPAGVAVLGVVLRGGR